MSEEEAIKKIEEKSSPLTVTSLKADLQKLGLKPGMVLLLHSSLSSLGWVCGGAVAVITAVEEVLGKTGTLVMPTFSTNLSDPSNWQNPPVPGSWWDVIRQEMPPYDQRFTPTRGVGTVPETFRNQKRVKRSYHPHISFAAWGEHAKHITDNHALDYPFGDGSPLARIYELDGWIMLLGTGYSSNSSFHLAEYRAKYLDKTVEYHYAPMVINGSRQWKKMEDYKSFNGDFNDIGTSFEALHPEKVSISTIGKATVRLIRQRDIVDYAVSWMSSHPQMFSGS